MSLFSVLFALNVLFNFIFGLIQTIPMFPSNVEDVGLEYRNSGSSSAPAESNSVSEPSIAKLADPSNILTQTRSDPKLYGDYVSAWSPALFEASNFPAFGTLGQPSSHQPNLWNAVHQNPVNFPIIKPDESVHESPSLDSWKSESISLRFSDAMSVDNPPLSPAKVDKISTPLFKLMDASSESETQGTANFGVLADFSAPSSLQPSLLPINVDGYVSEHDTAKLLLPFYSTERPKSDPMLHRLPKEVLGKKMGVHELLPPRPPTQPVPSPESPETSNVNQNGRSKTHSGGGSGRSRRNRGNGRQSSSDLPRRVPSSPTSPKSLSSQFQYMGLNSGSYNSSAQASETDSTSGSRSSHKVNGIRLSGFKTRGATALSKQGDKDPLSSLDEEIQDILVDPEMLDKSPLSQLPSDVLDRMATFMPAKDIARLEATSKSLYASVSSLLDIRTYYSKRHAYAASVSIVQLYLFCLRSTMPTSSLVYPKTLEACLSNVDRLVEREFLPMYRLQFLYEIINLEAYGMIPKEKLIPIFKTIFFGTTWSRNQLSSLLYFSASRCLDFFQVVFEKICIPADPISNMPSCRYSLLLAPAGTLLILLSSDAIRNHPDYAFIYDTTGALWIQHTQSFDALNKQLCDVESSPSLALLQILIMSYLYTGADVHHPCLHRFLIDRYSGHSVSERNPFVISFFEELLEFGYAVNDLNRDSLLLTFEDPTLVQFILDAGASVDTRYNKGYTALYYACRHNQLDKVNLLLQYGADPNNGRDGHTVLMVSESLEINRLLIGCKAHVNHVDREGLSPIFTAVANYQSLELTRLLVQHGANVLHTSPKLQTLLMLTRKPEVASYLLQYAFPIINAQDRDGLTAVHYAVMHWAKSVLLALIEWGADLNVADEAGQTPLMKANDVDLVQLLLNSKRVKVDLQDQYGYTALMFSVVRRNAGVVQLLLEHHADADLKNARGDDALSLARAGAGQGELSSKIIRALSPV